MQSLYQRTRSYGVPCVDSTRNLTFTKTSNDPFFVLAFSNVYDRYQLSRDPLFSHIFFFCITKRVNIFILELIVFFPIFKVTRQYNRREAPEHSFFLSYLFSCSRFTFSFYLRLWYSVAVYTRITVYSLIYISINDDLLHQP